MASDHDRSTDTPTHPLIDAETNEFEGTTEDRLPVPVDVDPMTLPSRETPTPRQYIEIRPTETPLRQGDIDRAMTQLYSLLERETRQGIRHTLTNATATPQLEWLLVSDGRPDTSVRYLVGTTEPALLPDIHAALRVCLPRTYELTEVEFHPRFVEDFCPVHAQPETPTYPSEASHSDRDASDSTHAGHDTDAQAKRSPVDPAYLAYPYVAGVEYEGVPSRRFDWLTPLSTRTDGGGDHSRPHATSQSRSSTSRSIQSNRAEQSRVALAGVLEVMSDVDVPVIYQVVCRYNGDVRATAETYVEALTEGDVSMGDHIMDMVFPRDLEDRRAYEPPAADRQRIAAIEARDTSRTVTLSARASVLTRHDPEYADRVATRLAGALRTLDGPEHTVQGRVETDNELHPLTEGPKGSRIFEELCSQRVHPQSYDSWRTRVPGRTHASRGILVTPEELPGFCVLDGARLTVAGERAVAVRPDERTGLALPPPKQLLEYRPPGMALGMALTHDRQPSGTPVYLRPHVQPTHQFIIGGTGSGKTVTMQTAALTNTGATVGPDIHFYHKAGAATDYLRAHYARAGTLDDVYYFDLTRVVPALSFFDIRDLLAAGIPREEARSRKAGHYEEILRALMGSELYDRAPESTKVVSNTVRALFDPIHGSDAYSHADFHACLDAVRSREETPATTDEGLTRHFHGLLERDRDVRTRILGGALGRVETIATDGRLAPLFNHVDERPAGDNETDLGDVTDSESGVPSSEEETGGSPSESDVFDGVTDGARFSFGDVINDDCVVLFDFGGMDEGVKRALTLVLFSDLWSALKARTERGDTAQPPLVNCYVDEAGGVADSSLMDTFLSEGRSFGLSMCLGVQYPGQLDSPDPADDTYLEALNEIATVVVGNVRVAPNLSNVFASGAYSAREIDERLANMPSGEWLVRPGSAFGDPTPRPFLARSLPALPGHPASEQPLTGSDAERYVAERELVDARTQHRAGIGLESLVPTETTDSDGVETDQRAREQSASQAATENAVEELGRTDSLLPYTARFPACSSYDGDRHAIECTTCGTQFDPAIEGLIESIECCHSLEAVDRDDIPVCSVNIKRSREEIVAAEWSLTELLFLQVVWDAQQRRLTSLEYDLRWDSMVRLREYTGLDASGVPDLIDAGLLRKNTTHPHLLYSVTAAGRDVIGEHSRQGINHGEGKGDLGESSHHVMLVQFAEDLARLQYVEDPDSAVEVVEPYYELEDGHRLDVVGLDAAGEVVLTIEAERVNNDVAEAALTDFDKMASCEPEDALWVVTSQTDAVRIMEALHEPASGAPRIDRVYSQTTPTKDYKLAAPGMSGIQTVADVRSLLDR